MCALALKTAWHKANDKLIAKDEGEDSMSKELLCTLGPASMNDRVITRLAAVGVSLFRINLSHTAIEKVEEVVRYVQARTDVPICLDTEGAQIRTGPIANGPVVLPENSFIRFARDPVPGDALPAGVLGY